MLDTPRSYRTPPRTPGAGARAVLFGYLLRSGARHKASVILERLDLEAVAKLVHLLDGEELRAMAALCFSDDHIGRAIALDTPALTRLFRGGDHDDVERCVRRLPPDVVRRILPSLPDERRRALEKTYGQGPFRLPAAGIRADRVLAALRLRRLFRR